MYSWFVAVRYLLSRPINLLGVAGVTMGVWALIVVVSVFSGYEEEIEKHVREAGADINVVYVPSRGPDYATLEEVLLEDPEAVACAPRLAWYGLLHPVDRPVQHGGGERDFGTTLGLDSPFQNLLGIDPGRERRATAFTEWLLRPDPELRVADPDDPLAPAADGTPAILISAARMRQDGLRPGDHVQVTTGTWEPRGGARTMQARPATFRVAGAFTTRHVGFDAANTFVHIDVLHGLLGEDAAEVNEVAVKLAAGADPDEAARRLARLLQPLYATLPVHPPGVWTWRHRNRTFLASIEHQGSLMKLVLIVILVVAAFLMLATLSMLVTEKTRDIGTLSALGASRAGVLRVFLISGLTITVLGTVLGLTTGAVSAVYLDEFNDFMRATFAVDLFPTRVYHLPAVPYRLDPEWLVQVAGLALLAGLLASLVPALRAAWKDPVEPLRHE